MLGLSLFLFPVLAPVPVPREPQEPRELSPSLEVLAPGIEAAIEGGVHFLLNDQQRDGSWPGHPRHRGGQTALSLYALLSSGVPADHPALVRGLRHLQDVVPEDVYTTSCALMAYGALHDPSYQERMRSLLGQLLEWRRQVWSYPHTFADGRWTTDLGEQDLSNTQFALLGLRAAQRAGLSIPTKVWRDLIPEVLRYQERPRALAEAGRERSREKDPVEIAGFEYRTGERILSGSMTAAGIACLRICAEGLGPKLKSKEQRLIQRATKAALVWLDRNWSVEENPSPSGAWAKSHWVYYLYGLERLGALLSTSTLGEHLWYVEGAQELLRAQLPGGAWSPREARSDTCFALLFLSRATLSRSGEARSRTLANVYSTEDPSEEVSLQAIGDPELTIWITGLKGRDLRVRAVEYFINDELLERVAGDPVRAWAGEKFAVKHRFAESGTYWVSAYVLLEDGPELASGELEVEMNQIVAPWMLEAAGAFARNRILGTSFQASASSSYSVPESAAAAFDGREDTRWLSSATDEHPTLTLELKRPVRAGRIVLNQAVSRVSALGLRNRIVRVRIRVNASKDTSEIALNPNLLRPTIFELPPRTVLRTLEIQAIDRANEGRIQAIGFTEIAIEE